MYSVQLRDKKERLNFYINSDLLKMINKISKQKKVKISEIARTALQYYIDQIEKKDMESKLEA